MNANIPKISDIRKVTRYHRKMIVGTVLRPEDSYPKRAERLKKLSFVDDDVKFQVLKESDLISQDLYDTLYALYFGETVPEKADAAENAANAEENEANAAENAAAEEVRSETVAEKTDEPAETTEKKKSYSQRLTDEQTLELINMHLSGAGNDELAELFGRTPEQITQSFLTLREEESICTFLRRESPSRSARRQPYRRIYRRYLTYRRPTGREAEDTSRQKDVSDLTMSR